MSQSYPGVFARFYDVIYHQIRDSADNSFFQNEIQRTDGKVLEIGVGTGRLFMNALNSGADIYGIDISESMLGVLSGKLTGDQKKRISLQNMIDFHFDSKFNLIIAPFRVIMHLSDKHDQIKAINNVYSHLENNGKFIFDTFIPDLNMIIKGLDNKVDFEGEWEPGKKLKRIVSTTPDLIKQEIIVNFQIEWEENEEIRHEECKIPLRFFFRFEMEHLIERSMFENYRILGDYHGNELNSKSKEFIAICNKVIK
jgi:SAM-dependent methyltransferase